MHTNTLLAQWALAPDWLTPAQAAQLLGPAYDADRILALVDSAYIYARRDLWGSLLIEKISLAAHQETIWRRQQHPVIN